MQDCAAGPRKIIESPLLSDTCGSLCSSLLLMLLGVSEGELAPSIVEITVTICLTASRTVLHASASRHRFWPRGSCRSATRREKANTTLCSRHEVRDRISKQ